jgi:hypothetical protein
MYPSGIDEKTRGLLAVELKKLPKSYTSGDRLRTSVQVILRKLGNFAPSVAVKRPAAPVVVDTKVEQLSQTVFAGDKLAARLVPAKGDSSDVLSSKVKELGSILDVVTRHMRDIRTSGPNMQSDPQVISDLQAEYRKFTDYRKQIINAIYLAQNLAQIHAQKDEAEEVVEKFDISSVIARAKPMFSAFISKLSKLPRYKDMPDVLQKVTELLNSMLDRKKPEQVVDPSKLDALMYFLNNMANLGDDFSNLARGIDSFRLKAHSLADPSAIVPGKSKKDDDGDDDQLDREMRAEKAEALREDMDKMFSNIVYSPNENDPKKDE